VPRTSIWARIANIPSWCKSKILVVTRAVGECFCAETFSAYDEYKVDSLVRAATREEMRKHKGYGALGDCVAAAINTVYEVDGYDLSEVKSRRAPLDEEAVEAKPIYEGEVMVAPRFVAACVLHLRAKLGALQNTEAIICWCSASTLRSAANMGCGTRIRYCTKGLC